MVSILSITYLCLFSRIVAVSGLSGTKNLITNFNPLKENLIKRIKKPRKVRTKIVKNTVYFSLSITLLVKQIIPAFTKIETKEIISRIVYHTPMLRAPFGKGLNIISKKVCL